MSYNSCMTLKKLMFTFFYAVLVYISSSVVIYLLLPSTVQPLYLQITGITVITLCYVIMIVDLVFLLPSVHGAIYLPSSDKNIAAILELAQVKKNEKAVDIGSGDGRIVAALSKAGANALGIEINPLLVLWSKCKYGGMAHKDMLHFRWASMWNVDFSQFQVVTLFGMSYIMKDLEKKLLRELKPGSRVICNSFPFPNWKVTKHHGSVYLYIKS